DHSAPRPANPAYDLLAESLVPADWFGPGRAAADAALGAYQAEYGPRALLEAFVGQYTHPSGIFFCGSRPVWANPIFRPALVRLPASAREVYSLDLHTGLGPFGYGEPICYHAPDSKGYAMARAAFGADITSPHLGNAASPPNHGKTGFLVAAALPGAEV